MRHSLLLVGLLSSTAACNASNGDALSTEAPSGTGDLGTATGAALPGTGATQPVPTNGGTSTGVSATTGTVGNESPGGGITDATGSVASAEGTTASESVASSGLVTTGGDSATDDTSINGTRSGGASSTEIDSSSPDDGTASSSPEGTSDPGEPGSQTNETSGSDPIPPSNCVGEAWPSANPTSAGPFQVAAEKGVGPLAGVIPDPIYGDQQQRYNVYHPANLAQSGYCHPILIWANGYTDNPEPNPPECVVDSAANKWCGQYLPLMNHLASHGFVVVASLSTATAEGDPLPTIAGLDWILEQAEDPSSPYYHRLDTANIGQLGHSYGGMSTCMSASEPRYKALATICGTRALSGVRTPMLFFCGEQDDTVKCAGVRETFLTVTDQPAFFLNELNADHGSWVYQGANGVSLSSAAAWFRAHLMNDTESRNYFYGAGCTFCTDNRVDFEQNSLMAQ